MEGVTQEDFQDREIGNEKHWVRILRGEITICLLKRDILE